MRQSMPKLHLQGSPTSKFRSRKYPELARSVGTNRGTIGSTASASGTENTRSAIAWPTRRDMARSEKDWSIDFARCVTNASVAESAEDHNKLPGHLQPGPVASVLSNASDARGIVSGCVHQLQ